MNFYAKLDEANTVVEFPVTEQQIKQRGHDFNWYTPCNIQPKPIAKKFQYVKQEFKVTRNLVTVTYTLLDMNINELLSAAHKGNTTIDVFVSNVDKPLFDKILTEADLFIENRLNDYAKSMGYNSSDRLASYVNSTVSKFANEATAFIQIRDAVWTSIIPPYIASIAAGSKELPKSQDDILAILPPVLQSF